MSELRTIVTFQSSAFNTTERKEYFINDCCYGDDVARWLIAGLRAGGCETDEDPGQEDFGWYLGFRVNNTPYHLVVGHREGDDTDPPVWVVWIERHVGFLGSIFGARRRGIQAEAVRAVHKVLASSQQVREVRWHFHDDFYGGREEKAAVEPLAA